MREANNPKLVIAALILLFAVLTAPAGALIATSTEATFDADGKSAGFGEEIQVQITIRPGDAEVRNLSIVLSEQNALIDDRSFRHTIDPTGAPVNVERDGHTFTCDHLARGESVVLFFNAYPKTLNQDTLTVADVAYTYIQQGESLQGSDTITVDTSSSLWFQNIALKSENDLSWTLYVGIVLIIISIALLGYQAMQGKKGASASNAELQKMRALLKEVDKNLDAIQDNPSIKEDLRKKIKRELGSEKSAQRFESPVPDNDKQKRDSRF